MKEHNLQAVPNAAGENRGYRGDAMGVEFKKVGVGGIPTFIFGSEPAEGCQPYEVLAAVALRTGDLDSHHYDTS